MNKQIDVPRMLTVLIRNGIAERGGEFSNARIRMDTFKDTTTVSLGGRSSAVTGFDVLKCNGEYDVYALARRVVLELLPNGENE